MGMQSTSREILLKSVAYHASDGVLHYVFLVGEAEFYFLARIRSIGGIRGVEYTDALERFLMSIMPEDPGISKKICAISLGCADGVDFSFPVNLVEAK